jgi:hypothetical protein
MLLFIAAVGQAGPAVGAAVQREVRAAGDSFPSRYKGTWPALRAKREARERQEDAVAGVARGSVLAAAGRVLAAGMVHEVQTLADGVPYLRSRWRRSKAWQRLREERRSRRRESARAMGLPPDGVVLGAAEAAGRAIKAGAANWNGAAGFKKSEEKLGLARKDVTVRRHARRAGLPAVVQLAYLTGSGASSTADAGEAAARSFLAQPRDASVPAGPAGA